MIKVYLIKHPLFVPPTPGLPLILYLAIQKNSLGFMLVQLDKSDQSEHVL